METEPIAAYELGNKTLKIYSDISAGPPRENDDGNIGIMLCFHTRYSLGDIAATEALGKSFSKRFSGWGEMREYIEKELKGICILPLFLYDHSGISIKVGSFSGLPQGHAEFDSGQVGFIYTTRARCTELGVKLRSKKLEAALRQEVEIYNQYLTGEVYGFVIEENTTCDKCGHVAVEVIDSCWGFYGSDIEENGILDNIGKEWRAVVEKKK